MGEDASTQQWACAAGSICLGALVGTLIGLSVNAVVGNVLTALLALIGGYVGLRDDGVASRGNVVRIAFFSFSCLLAIVVSLYARAHGTLSPDIEKELQLLQSRHLVTREDVRAVILLKKFGIAAEGYNVTAPQAGREDTVLFANPDAPECANLQAENYENSSDWLGAMRSAGGAWTAAANNVAARPVTDHRVLLERAYHQLCDR